jgi:ComF family protein
MPHQPAPRKAGARARSLLRTALDLAYPRNCETCGREPEDPFDYLCWECLSSLLYLAPPMCDRCGEPVEGRVGHRFDCHLCASTPRGFDHARSLARHDGALRHAIHVFKYRQGTWLRSDLCRLLHTGWTTHYPDEEIDLVTWVPLHPARRRSRGYDQARLLAAGLARRLGQARVARTLVRVRDTGTQTNLTAELRASNVRQAFSPRNQEQLNGRRVLLVDDVMTTGATVSECARCLKEAGAERVLVITLARG